MFLGLQDRLRLHRHGPRISLRRIQSHRAKYAQRNFWLVLFVIQDRKIRQAGGSRKRGMSWNSQQIFSRSLFWPPFPSRSGSPARVSLMDPQVINLAEAGTWRAPSPASWGWIKSKLVTTCRGTAVRYATDRRYCVRSRSRASATGSPIGRQLGNDLAPPRRRFRPPLRAYSLGRVGCWHLEQMESRLFTGGDSLA